VILAGLRIYYVYEVVPPQSLPPLSTEEVKPELALPPDEAGKQAEPAPANGNKPNEKPAVHQAQAEAIAIVEPKTCRPAEENFTSLSGTFTCTVPVHRVSIHGQDG
jgi:hypothetical protein